MDNDKIDYVKTFRKSFLVDHITIKDASGINTLKDVAVYWDPDKCFILDNNDIMAVVDSDNIVEIKLTKETTKTNCAMIIHQVMAYYPALFDKRKPSNVEVG